MELNFETISAIALGIGLSASAGFRIFVPLLIAALFFRLGYVPLGEGFQWMASTPVILCLGVAAIVESLSYYIPLVDNLLDSIATPLALVAGSVLMTSVLPVDNEWMKWIIGIIVGGGGASTVQAGSVISRLISTGATGGLANPILTTLENFIALFMSILAVFLPIIAMLILLALILIIVRFGLKKYHQQTSAKISF